MAARLLLATGSLAGALGFAQYQSKIPNGASVARNGQAWPGVGHTLAGGGPSGKNPFGSAFQAAGHTWTAALCQADSDGDGQSNGMELGDPSCTWTEGSAPARTSDISHPGYADSTTSSAAPGAGETTTTRTASTSTASTVTASTTTASTSTGTGQGVGVGTASDIALTGGRLTGLAVSFQPVGSGSVELTVTLNRNSWVSFGVSAGNSVSMSGNGQGADVVACTGGQVMRYWVTSQDIPSGSGVQVPGSTCTQAGGTTTMTFTRKVAAETAQQQSITPGTSQQVIFAHGADGATAMGYHGSLKGGQGIDFATGAAEAAAKRSGETFLYVHLVLMSIAWAGLLPLGAVIAKWLKRVEGAPQGAWFRRHRELQSVGWVLQILGFAAAVWFVQEHSSHFQGPHARIGLAVVIVGTLQPLNAALRPHPEPRTRARVAFEVVHKGLGWIAVLLGIFNVAVGIYIVSDRGYETTVVAVALAIAVLSVLPGLLVFALACLWPNNPIARLLTRAEKVHKGRATV
mmetsp:Transcript_21471/g.62162  ORF Transcript_21471/g.62162 Transcript_21471/m.62162 type:complete len:517 (-) Transcript_21471:379-1929(-)